MTRTTAIALSMALITAMSVTATAPAASDRDTERAAANLLSDLVNEGRAVKPVYTEPDEVTRKTLLELLNDVEPDPSDDSWMQDPFVALDRDMTRVVDGLDKQRTDDGVRGDQQEIVRKLDVLIEQLEQASKNCNGACNGNGNGDATNNPTSPMKDSQLTGGPGGMGELRDPGKGNKPWAKLPPKQREKILQSKTDGFPAGYEEVLEEYYRRLAEAEADSTDAGSDDNE